MKQNLGTADRVLRFVLAFWWLGPLAPQYGILVVDWAIFLVGWLALLESFLGWCWLHKRLGLDKKR